MCISYTTQAACLTQPAEACGWDRVGGGCFLSASAASDPELLLGRLYCPGSLLDTAAACALLVPQLATGASGGGGSGGSNVTSGGDACAAANPACVALTPAQLAALGPAAATYAALAAVVTYSATDGMIGAGGCAARWLTQADTLAALGRGVAAPPAAGLLQPGLIGSCPGVGRLARVYAAAAANCSAPSRSASVEACNGGGGVSCRWEEAADAGGGTCGVGDDVLLDILYDPNDPWVRAFRTATDVCDGRTSRAACEAAGGRIRIDPARMAAFKDVLLHGGGAGAGLRAGGGVRSRLMWAALGAGGLAVAAGVLWSGTVS